MPMSIVNSLRRRLDGDPTYECAVCAATFDREPPNCPTCGSAVVRTA